VIVANSWSVGYTAKVNEVLFGISCYFLTNNKEISMMNIGSTQGTGVFQFPNGKPPPPEHMAARMADRVASGEIESGELQARLEERFGEEASAVFTEDGAVDVEALTSLIGSNRASASGTNNGGNHRGIGPLRQISTTEELQAKLTDRFGEESSSTVFNEDGSVNFDQLISLVNSGREDKTGLMVDMSA